MLERGCGETLQIRQLWVLGVTGGVLVDILAFGTELHRDDGGRRGHGGEERAKFASLAQPNRAWHGTEAKWRVCEVRATRLD